MTETLDRTALGSLTAGSPVNLEEFEYIFAPEQARECLSIWDELSDLTLIGHSHLCKVFALTKDSVEELPVETFALEPDRKYVVSVGSVGHLMGVVTPGLVEASAMSVTTIRSADLCECVSSTIGPWPASNCTLAVVSPGRSGRASP